MTEQDSLIAEDAKVAEALRFVGLQVESIYDLVNSKQDYSRAIPVLLRMLHDAQHPRIKEGIARALSVKEARPVAKELIEEYKSMRADSMPSQHVKWAIGNALSVAGSDDVIEELIALVRDRQHGWTRAMLPLGLANAKTKRTAAVAALIDALTDDQVACQAADALAMLKAKEALVPLQRLTKHQNKDIRKAATKALKRLQK